MIPNWYELSFEVVSSAMSSVMHNKRYGGALMVAILIRKHPNLTKYVIRETYRSLKMMDCRQYTSLVSSMASTEAQGVAPELPTLPSYPNAAFIFRTKATLRQKNDSW